MKSPSRYAQVYMPDNSFFDVTYYCNDRKLTAQKKKTQTQLFIQHHDCISVIDIDKVVCENDYELETLVYNRVLNTKGHLC